MNLSKSKGLSNLPVYVSIAILALLVVGTAVGQLFRLPPAFGQTVDEAGVITEAETRLDDTLNHFLPLAAHYSVSEAAYQVGSNNTNYTGVDNGGTSEMDVYAPMIDKVDKMSQTYFQNYSNSLNYDRCDVETDDQAVLNISYESTKVNITANNSNPLVAVECNSPEVDIRTETEKGKETSYNITNVRFHELAALTYEALKEIERVSEELESNNNLDGTVTKTSACTYDESTYGSPGAAKDAAKNDAFNDAYSEAPNKIEEVEKALVERDHGIGSGSNRGAKEVLWQSTNSGFTCLFGWCPANLWVDDIDYNAYVVDNETSFSGSGNTTSQCDCYDYNCEDQDPDEEYTYRAAPDACVHDDESYNPMSGFSNTYDPVCPSGGVNHDGSGNCLNATGHDIGDPVCNTNNDFSHDGNGDCEVDEDDGYASGRPSPVCTNKVFEAESDVGWEYQRTEIQINVTDTKFTVPTSNNWINLFMNRKYVRNYNP